MMWDDDEQYVPPVITNPNYLDERPQIFGDDNGYNELLFSTEELKLQYH